MKVRPPSRFVGSACPHSMILLPSLASAARPESRQCVEDKVSDEQRHGATVTETSEHDTGTGVYDSALPKADHTAREDLASEPVMLSNSARNEAGRPKLKLRGLSAQIRMSLLWSLCVMTIIGLAEVPYFIFVLGEQNSGDRGNTTSSTSSSGSALPRERCVCARPRHLPLCLHLAVVSRPRGASLEGCQHDRATRVRALCMLTA